MTVNPTYSYNKPIVWLAETESTNKYATALLKDNPTDGTAIVAEYQTQGKGQMNNRWESERGKNILMSVIWKNMFLKADEGFYINKAVTFAVHQFLLNCFGIEAHIKWPNDIMVGDKKIGGILAENTISGNQIKSTIVGLGININQAKFSDEFTRAISARMISGNDYPLEMAVNLLLGYLNQAYQLLKMKQYSRLTDFYMKHLYRLNENHDFIIDGEIIEATIVGVTRWGKLMVLHNSEFKSFNNKEIEFVY